MRFLHTSDWHLGRSLHGEPMLAHQRAFLGWLRDLALEREVAAVLVAGDVYDRAVPSLDAVQALDEALASFVSAAIPVVLISGNHDSAVRLGFGSSLHQVAGVHLRTRIADLDRPVVLRDDSGEVGVYGIPYLLPDAAREELGAERSHASVLAAATARIRADAAARGLDRTVVLAHAFVTGGLGSGSERDISVGGIGDAPVDVFEGIGYVALGHLHGAQQVGAAARYSGSPLAFSFSEKSHTKSVAVVEMDAAGAVEIECVPTPVPRPLREVRGRLDDLLARADTDLAECANAWVKVVLTDPARPMAPMERLRERWPHTLVLDFAPEGAPVEPSADLARLEGVSDPVEICASFMEWVDSTRPNRAQQDTLYSVVEAVRRAEAVA
jgi:exonuclease SbcD